MGDLTLTKATEVLSLFQTEYTNTCKRISQLEHQIKIDNKAYNTLLTTSGVSHDSIQQSNETLCQLESEYKQEVVYLQALLKAKTAAQTILFNNASGDSNEPVPDVFVGPTGPQGPPGYPTSGDPFDGPTGEQGPDGTLWTPDTNADLAVVNVINALTTPSAIIDKINISTLTTPEISSDAITASGVSIDTNNLDTSNFIATSFTVNTYQASTTTVTDLNAHKIIPRVKKTSTSFDYDNTGELSTPLLNAPSLSVTETLTFDQALLQESTLINPKALVGSSTSGVIIGFNNSPYVAASNTHLGSSASLSIMTNGVESINVGTTGTVSISQSPLYIGTTPFVGNKQLGLAQTWTNVTSERQLEVVYTNSTPRPIYITAFISGNNYNSNNVFRLYINGTTVQQFVTHHIGTRDSGNVNGIVPSGQTYRVSNVTGLNTAAVITSWYELR